jgi:hypothetical protein
MGLPSATQKTEVSSGTLPPVGISDPASERWSDLLRCTGAAYGTTFVSSASSVAALSTTRSATSKRLCGHKARIQTIALLVRALAEHDAVRSQPGLQPRIVSLANAALLLVILRLAPPTRTSRSQLQKWHTRLERWMRSCKRLCSVILYSPQLPDRQRVQQDGTWYCKGRDHDRGIGADL